MKLRVQRRLAAAVLNCGLHRVVFNPERLADIKEAITKQDLRLLVADGAISAAPKSGVSRFRARKLLVQRRKGRRQGSGSRSGRATARLSSKRLWINKVRVQRRFLQTLKSKNLVSPAVYSQLRSRVKGGFFRSKRHLQLFITEKGLVTQHGKK